MFRTTSQPGEGKHWKEHETVRTATTTEKKESFLFKRLSRTREKEQEKDDSSEEERERVKTVLNLSLIHI